MSEAGTASQTLSDADDDKPQSIARYIKEITLYDREAEKWAKRSKKILRRFKDDRNSTMEDKRGRFNILWSNTQTLLPALYAKNPKPDIQRRFKDADPIGRAASDVLERCVTYFTDTDEFGSCMRQNVLDYLLVGRGTSWIRYVPHMKPSEEITDAPQEGEDLDPPEEVDYEEVLCDYVHREDFGHNVARTWEEVWCIWRIAYLTKDELIDRFGSRGKTVPLDHQEKKLNGSVVEDVDGKATIYELWDKKRKLAVWFHKSIPTALDARDDPLNLDGFFPCPKPIFTNLENTSLIPTPDYIEYQDQAIELDNLTARITSITQSIKVAGVYDASAQGIERLLSEGGDNTLIPVEQWAVLGEKGGLDGIISWLPIEQASKALQALTAMRNEVIQNIYQITGIPDIVRGVSDPNETLGAQQIKTSFTGQRIGDRQRDVQRFVREVVRIMVDIICNHFSPQSIQTISGVQLLTNQQKAQATQYAQVAGAAQQQGQQPPPMPPLPPGMDVDKVQELMSEPSWEDVQALISNNVLRCFRVDIETDSTIKSDEEADKESRLEFLKAVGGFMQQAVQAGDQQPEMAPVLGQLLMFGVRGFPIGKELEGSIQSAIDQLAKQAKNPQQKPTPEQQKVQGDLQIEQMRGQVQLQIAKGEQAAQAAQSQQENQLEAQRDQQKAALDAQTANTKMQHEMALEQYRIQAQGQIEIEKAHISAAASIEVARINALKQNGSEEYAREASAEGLGTVQPDAVPAPITPSPIAGPMNAQ